MYPFIVTWHKNVFAWFDYIHKSGQEATLVLFWYPTITISFLPKRLNFITDEPEYPDLSAPWNKHLRDDYFWDEMNF